MKNIIKNIKYLSFVILAFNCILYIPSISYAASPYNTYGLQNGKASVAIRVSSYNPNWTTLINNSRVTWNNSANVNITQNDNSPNWIEAGNYDKDWYGLTTSSYNSSTGYISTFNIQINGKTINQKATNVSNFVMSVMSHEFGHLFWLCDNPVTSSTSIMDYNRNRNTMTSPQQFDISNVNAKYR